MLPSDRVLAASEDTFPTLQTPLLWEAQPDVFFFFKKKGLMEKLKYT